MMAGYWAWINGQWIPFGGASQMPETKPTSPGSGSFPLPAGATPDPGYSTGTPPSTGGGGTTTPPPTTNYNPNDPNIPPRPQAFSPMTPQEQAAAAAWDAQYGPNGTYWTTPNGGAPGTPPIIPPGTPPPPGAGGGTSTPYTQSPVAGGGGQAPGMPSGFLTPSGGGTPVNTNAYAQIASLLPGYGMQQSLGSPGHGFGIPGFENSPQTAGGSWAGTTFMPNGPSTQQNGYIPASDVTNPNSPFYRPIYKLISEPIQPGEQTQFQINPAVPYQTSWYLSTYGGKPAPFTNIHEQIGKSMEGVPTAMPGFAWAGPQAMANAQPGGTGMPPGGWTQMLGYTPGAPSNYGFQGGRPNPYGITSSPLSINPSIG